MFRGTTVALASCLFLLVPGARAGKLIPYVGTLKALDPATKTFTIVGPDEKEMQVTLTGRLMEEGKGPFREDSLENALKYVGRRIGVRLIDEKTAHLACIMPEGDLRLLKGWISQVEAEELKIHIRSSDGYMIFYRPAVNMAARSTKDGPLEDASWEWFEARIDKPYVVRLARMAGIDVIWSIDPWDPKEDEKDEAKPAAGEAPVPQAP